jgi:hypothetical protein
MKAKINWYPLIIVLLLAMIALLFSMLVIKKIDDPKINLSTQTESTGTQIYHWKMVTSWPKNTPGLGVSAEKMKLYLHLVYLMQCRPVVRRWGTVALIFGEEKFPPHNFLLQYLLV